MSTLRQRKVRLRAADLTLRLATWLAKPSGYHGEWVSRSINWTDVWKP